MFKKVCMAGLLAFSSFLVQAQVDFSAINFDLGGNYTRYLGDFQQATTGIKAKLSVPFSENFRFGIGYNHAMKLKVPSSIEYYSGYSVGSELVYNFKTFSLDGNYFFSSQEDEGFNAYALAGIGLVLVSFQEQPKATLPVGLTPLTSLEKQSLNGFSIHGGIGAEYSFGLPKIFAEAEIAMPANRVNNTEVSNPIPAHFMFNIGFRIGLSGGYSDY
jgi:hypothetical protein